MSFTSAQLEDFVRALAGSPERWRSHVRHHMLERKYAVVWEDEDVNAWLICWSPGQDTGFHDHDESAAAITVIEGTIVEDRLCLLGPPLSQRHTAGATFALPAAAIHRVRHVGGPPAVSIHAYSPPLSRTGAYRVAEDGRLERDALGVDTELRAARPAETGALAGPRARRALS